MDSVNLDVPFSVGRNVLSLGKTTRRLGLTWIFPQKTLHPDG